MYQNITRHDFIEQFRTMGRMDPGDGKGEFSYNGLCALFDYLVDLESDTGDEIEFGVIALCCQFSEYGSALEAVEDHDPEAAQELVADSDDQEDAEKAALYWLEGCTSVIEFPGGIIIDSEF